MGKIIKEYETEYNIGDVVVFEKNNIFNVGIIEGYYVEDERFWFNMRVNPEHVYTYSNDGDVSEYDIIGVINDNLKEKCFQLIAKK